LDKRPLFFSLFSAGIVFFVLLLGSGGILTDNPGPAREQNAAPPAEKVCRKEKETRKLEDIITVNHGRAVTMPVVEKPKIEKPPAEYIGAGEYGWKPLNGKWVQEGIASWYGSNFHGGPTASGETYDMYSLTAAHRELPFDTVVKVTHLGNNRSVVVRINNRGPFIEGRVIDLSKKAAEAIGMKGSGLARVRVKIVEEPR